MSSRIKPSLHEVLNYPEESRRMLMQGFSDAVDRIAANNRRTDIELFQVCRALGEPNVPALLSLCDDGPTGVQGRRMAHRLPQFPQMGNRLHAIPAADETTNRI